MRIVADDKIPFLKGVFEPICDVSHLPGAKISPGDVKEANAIITRTRTVCDSRLLSGSAVEFIATATIGHDHIDADYCEKNNIAWTNAPGCNSSSVEQYVCSALLRLAEKHDFSLSGKTLGVVGVGNVGKKVSRAAKSLGMNVLLNDPPRGRREGSKDFSTLEQIVSEADIITFHVPLQKEGQDKTYHMVDQKLIESMCDGAILINSSRGEVVDGDALKDALRAGKLKGAVLDVWEDEPDIDLELLDLLDIATPHIAGYSLDGKFNGTTMSVHAVSKFFGLGLENWRPENVPVPENTTITIDTTGKTDQQVLLSACVATYDPLEDDERLRNSPETFEKQRAEYPLRRESHVYTVKLEGDAIRNAKLSDTIKKLGFQLAS